MVFQIVNFPFSPCISPGDHSPYHELSGLPDPYMDSTHVQEEPSVRSQQQQHMGMSFEESLESGYSTPNSRNRRVIREIIV
jgi:echinoid protein